MTDSIFRSTSAIPDLLADGIPGPSANRRISDETSLGGTSSGDLAYCARVVSVMIAQRWETRVQRGTQPVRLKTGCTNFRTSELTVLLCLPKSSLPGTGKGSIQLQPTTRLRTLPGGKLCNEQTTKENSKSKLVL